jgi:hypothetical protein
MNEVQSGVAVELSKDALDPMAIGLAYVEIEVIRRELRAELVKLRVKVREVLTSVQSVKLKLR